MSFSFLSFSWFLLLSSVILSAAPEQTTRRPAGTARAAAPETFTQLAQQAAEAKDRNDLEAAVRLYGSAVKLRPTWAEGWWFLGTIHYERDQYADCRTAFERFVKLQSNAPPAYAMLGLCQYQLREYAPAFSNLVKSEQYGLKLDSALGRVVTYHQALLLIAQENYERALFLLKELAGAQGDRPEVRAAMGIAAMRKPLLPKQVPERERAVALRLGEAIMLAHQRRPAEAKGAFEEVIAANESMPNIRYTYGTYLLGLDTDMAVEQWKAELKLDPRHLPSLVSLAMTLLTLGKTDEARSFAKQAVEVDPNHFTTRLAAGRAALQAESYAEAVKHLEIAVKLADDSPQARLALASAYAKVGRKQEAEAQRAVFKAMQAKLQSGQQRN